MATGTAKWDMKLAMGLVVAWVERQRNPGAALRARPRIALGAVRATRKPQYAEERPHDRRFPAPFHAARIDQGGPGRPPDPQLRRLGRAELYDPFAAVRSRRARADDGFGRHRRRLADQRRRH